MMIYFARLRPWTTCEQAEFANEIISPPYFQMHVEKYSMLINFGVTKAVI